MNFIVENLIQKTPSWHSWRAEGITATDITVIMGINPYKSIDQLYREKTGHEEPIKDNVAIKHGVEQEPIARSWIEAHQGIKLDSPCVRHKDHSIARCSLDGLDQVNKVLYEIKSPYSFDKVFDAIVFDKVPEYWTCQLQWQLFVTGYSHGFLSIWDSKQETCHFLRVEADPQLQKNLLEKALEFWKHVETLTPPEGALVSKNSEPLREKFERYFQIKENLKQLAQEEEVLKKELFENQEEYRCFSYSVKKKKSPSSYDYKKMQQDGIEIANYLKPSSYHFTITKEKDCYNF